MNMFNEKEFFKICEKLNTKPYSEEITLSFNTGNYFNKLKRAVETERRGEVVFCVIRPNGKIIMITCKEYPEGIFRIPTGGIGYHEDIINAVFREVKEELGLDVIIERFAGVLNIRFEHKESSFMFYSYLFILKEIGGRLLLDASDDEISEVKEVDVEELEDIVGLLRNIPGKWSDWGIFRYETSNAIVRHLKSFTI